MHLPITNGTYSDIQGLNCCLPPEGYVYNVLTKKVEYRGIHSRSNIPEEQYWEKPPLPVWYLDVIKKWDLYDKKKHEDDDEFYDERLEEFKKQEWDRRLNGFWVMIFNPKTKKSEATYLTGMYYMLLTWWIIDIGLPSFTMPHLNKMYFLQYCIEDPLCFGMIDITKRRFLKTFIGGLFITERVSRTKSTNGSIQSKTGKDAKKVFSKAVVDPFRRLPKFFRPEYDMSLGVNPKTEMRFQKTNIRGKKAEEGVGKDELNSAIDWESADEIALDGQKLFSYFGDEFAKTKEANVFERHEVIRYCLLDHEGKIIGKALYSSTVEEVENETNDISKSAKQLWDASNQYQKQENGQTQSGLYRFFQTADESKNFDKYGYPDIEKNIKSILADRKAAEKNPRQLAGRIRKEPRTADEAWMISSDKCVFNVINIAEREKFLSENPIFKRKAWYYRDFDGGVKWREPLSAESSFCWEHTEMLNENEINKKSYIQGLLHPGRKDKGAIGVDGLANSQGGKFGSQFCAWLGTRVDSFDANSGKVLGRLFGRPTDLNIAYEQVMLAAEYWGYLVFWEFVADGYWNFFNDRGRINYLSLFPLITLDLSKNPYPERQRGVPTIPSSLMKQLELGMSYFENRCHLIDWIELLVDAKEFDPNDRTKSDTTVSFLIWLVGIAEPIHNQERPKAPLIKVYTNYRNSEGVAS